MKSNQFLKEGFVEDANEVHADHEVQMARSDLFHAAEDALSLHKLLRNVSEQQGLEGWVAAKITLAADYLKTVREHVEYQLMSGGPAVVVQTTEMPIAESEEDIEESEDMWGPEGNFAGDKKVDVGGTSMKKIQVGDTVRYFGEKAQVVELNPANNYARISADGKTLNVRLSDLKQLGQGGLDLATLRAAAKTAKPVDQDVAEGMPASVIQAKEKIRMASDEENKKRFAGKTKEKLAQMARRHGYGDKNPYAKFYDGVTEGQVNEMSSGSVATVVNPTPKNKAKVGSLFGGTYKQKSTK